MLEGEGNKEQGNRGTGEQGTEEQGIRIRRRRRIRTSDCLDLKKCDAFLDRPHKILVVFQDFMNVKNYPCLTPSTRESLGNLVKEIVEINNPPSLLVERDAGGG